MRKISLWEPSILPLLLVSFLADEKMKVASHVDWSLSISWASIFNSIEMKWNEMKWNRNYVRREYKIWSWPESEWNCISSNVSRHLDLVSRLLRFIWEISIRNPHPQVAISKGPLPSPSPSPSSFFFFVFGNYHYHHSSYCQCNCSASFISFLPISSSSL